jgi:endonuclease/exonuclease/phosphatase family metal-dependent hydrolase
VTTEPQRASTAFAAPGRARAETSAPDPRPSDGRRRAWVSGLAPARLWAALLVVIIGLSGGTGLAGEAGCTDPAASGQRLRVLTWNVLAPSPGERLLGWLPGWRRGGSERARLLLAEAKGLGADVLGFQEVGGGFMAALAQDGAWADHHASAQGPEAPPGGLLVLSRHPFAKVAYRKLPSASGRYALFATIDLRGEALVVANVHLESPPEDSAARTAQLDFVEARLPRGGLTVWLGDFNFGDQDPEAARLAGWTDAWTRLQPGEAGYSYDLEANPVARKNAFAAEPSRRLDRILSTRRLVPVAVGLVGKTGQPDPPSDHYGLWADLVPSPAKAP